MSCPVIVNGTLWLNNRGLNNDEVSAYLQVLTDSVKANVRHVDLSYNKLTTVPVELLKPGNFPALQILNLSYNDISSIPPLVSIASTLTRLDVHANCLATLPGSLAQLCHLEVYVHNHEMITLYFYLLFRLYLNFNRRLPPHSSSWSSQGTISTQCLLHDIAALAERRYEKVRSAVTAWLIISRNAGVVKDLRLLIGSRLWSTKEDVEWEMLR